MNKNLNIANQMRTDSESGLSSSVWLKENEALIEKLEAAYQAAPEISDSDEDNQFYGIQFSGLNLLIDKDFSSELLEDSVVYPIPLASEWMIGVVNVRGDIIPVIDIERLISGESATQNANSKIIVINKGEDAIGFLLEHLPKPISFSEDEKLSTQDTLPEIVHEHVVYSFIKDEAIWANINFESFLQSINI